MVPPQLIAEITAAFPRVLAVVSAARGRPGMARGPDGALAELQVVRLQPVTDRLDAAVQREVLRAVSREPPPTSQQREVAGHPVRLIEAAGWVERADKSECSAVDLLVPPAGAEVLFETDDWAALRKEAGEQLRRSPAYTHSLLGFALGMCKAVVGQRSGGGRKKGKEATEPRDMDAEHRSLLRDAAAALVTAAAAVEGAGAAAGADPLADPVDEAKRLLEEHGRLAAALGKVPKSKAKPAEDWLVRVCKRDFEEWRAGVSAEKVPDAGPADVGECGMYAEIWPKFRAPYDDRARMQLLIRSGSWMYDLSTPTSDEDYFFVYIDSLVKQTAPHPTPLGGVHCCVQAEFGADKAGVVEYCGLEIGDLANSLAKGNPKYIELLFTEKPRLEGWAMRELRERRMSFITKTCAAQYAGFVLDRVKKVREKYTDVDGTNEAAVRKLLYHATHKLSELRRIVVDKTGPIVALSGDERAEVMRLRLAEDGPMTRQRALEYCDRLDAGLKQLREARETVDLPADVDVDALLGWLRGVRERDAVS